MRDTIDKEMPQILLFDCGDSVAVELEKFNYSYTKASLGENIKINKTNAIDTYFHVYRNYPENIHEYDVFIIDMKGREFDREITEEVEIKGQYVFQVKYPNDIFFSTIVMSELIELPKKVFT